MNKLELEKIHLKQQLHQELIKYDVVISCLNCYYRTDVETCAKYNCKPPDKVLVYGCDEWLVDIPF